MATIAVNPDFNDKIDSMLNEIETKLCKRLPLNENPYWHGIQKRLLTERMIIIGDKENAMRAKIGQPFRIHMLEVARMQGDKELNRLVWEVVYDEIFAEPDHLELRMQMLRRKGIDDSDLDLQVRPFTKFAIQCYKELAYNSTSAVTPMIAAGMVEKYYAYMCEGIYNAYKQNYTFTHDDAKTYYVHSTVDLTHAENAVKIAKQFITDEKLLEEARNGIILAWVATHFLYLGMLQATTDEANMNAELRQYLREFLVKLFEVTAQLKISAK